MTLPDIIALAAIALIVGGAVFYIIRAKKKGKKCIGCPDSSACHGGCAGCQHAAKQNNDEI